MSEFRIPKQFKIFGQTITVECDEDLCDREGYLGRSRYSRNKVIIQPGDNKNKLTQDAIADTFFHEMLHICLDAMNRKDLNEDEGFVCVLAALFHQALTTMEYDSEPETEQKIVSVDAQWIIDKLKMVPRDYCNDTIALSGEFIQDIMDRLEKLGGKL